MLFQSILGAEVSVAYEAGEDADDWPLILRSSVIRLEYAAQGLPT
jgi:hypothetical protein